MKILQVVISISIFLLCVCEASFAQGTAKEIDNKGVEYSVQGKFEKAKVEFEKALKDDSLYSPAQLNLKTINDILKKKIKRETGILIFKGIQYDNQGQYNEAISEYNKAIELDPKYDDSYNKRGLVYYNKKNYEQAIEDYTTAIQLNSKNTDAYNNRGIVYYQLDQNDKAISDYTKAIEINPEYAKAYHNRGLTYIIKLKNIEKGCADWYKACELGECTNYNTAKEKNICK
jgi:tetratricopeptide (TPR) repeat protein